MISAVDIDHEEEISSTYSSSLMQSPASAGATRSAIVMLKIPPSLAVDLGAVIMVSGRVALAVV